MTYSNADILAAIINKFAQPIVVQFAQAKASSFPVVNMIENKVKSWGIVSQNWSLVSELSPMIEPITGSVVKPMIKQYLSQIPDASIPAMAHGLVDKALENGGLSLIEGRLQFEKEDLIELKKLLNYNLPLVKQDEYEVLLSPPKQESEVENGTEDTANKQSAK